MSAGLIVAIGAQNAFVLKQGIKKQEVFLVALFCSLMDALLICAGVLGLGSLINAWPLVLRLVTGGGCLFLVWYGIRSFRLMLHPATLADETGVEAAPVEASGSSPRRAIITSLLAFTLLNPHVYLDTVVLLGGIGARHFFADRLAFVAGACSASIVWFFCLAYGAGFLAPLFRKALTWRILDGLIALVMFFIAVQLAISVLTAAG